jgi:predicted anti-sigma-YlaC factor YlaD
MNCDESRMFLSALVDNELDTEQKKLVTEHLVNCEDCRLEYARMLKLKEVTDDMKYLDLPDRLWAGYWNGIYNRIERGFGWILLSLGAIILVAFGAWRLLNEFFLDPRPPLLLKIGLGALIAGMIVLLISVIRERIFSRAHDRYEEVEL